MNKNSYHNLDYLFSIIAMQKNATANANNASLIDHDSMMLKSFGTILNSNLKNPEFEWINNIPNKWFNFFKDVINIKNDVTKTEAFINDSANKVQFLSLKSLENTVLDKIGTIKEGDEITFKSLEDLFISNKESLLDPHNIMWLWHSNIVSKTLLVTSKLLKNKNDKNQSDLNEFPLISILYTLCLKQHSINQETSDTITRINNIIKKINNSEMFYLLPGYKEKDYGKSLFYKKIYEENIFSEFLPNYEFPVSVKYQYTQNELIQDMNVYYFILINLLRENITLFYEEFEQEIDSFIGLCEPTHFYAEFIYLKLIDELKELTTKKSAPSKEEIDIYRKRTLIVLNNLNDKIGSTKYKSLIEDIRKRPIIDKINNELIIKMNISNSYLIILENLLKEFLKEYIYDDILNLAKSIHEIVNKIYLDNK